HHFTEFYYGQYSPVNTLIYIVLYKLFGFNAMVFHTAFLVFHIINVLFLFYILKEIIKTVNPKFENGTIRLYSGCVALIFAIHPLQVETVAWISASKIVLYAFFMFIAIWCYINYIKSTKIVWLIAVLLLYALSFGSKEQAIILPLNLLVFDYIYGRLTSLKFNKTLLKQRVLLEKIPFFLMAFGFWYFSSLFNLGNIIVEETYPIHQRLLFGMHSMVEYVFRSIAPVKLYYHYFYPIEIGEKLPWFFWGYLVLTIIIVGFIWSYYKRKNKLVLFGFALFIINILLVLHILPMPRKMITADRYMYVSIIGLAIIGVWFFKEALNTFLKYRKQLFAAGILYLFALGVQSHYRTRAWKDSETMKKNVQELIEKRNVLKQPIINNPLIDRDGK
ncbi:hypothetical protein, partial [Arenibacter lacus]